MLNMIVLAAILVAAGTPAGTLRTNPRDGLTYAWIPAGIFTMGCSSPRCEPNEHPAHRVTISRGFWIGTTEVPVGAFKRYARATSNSMPPEATEFGNNPGWKNDRLPIANVTWAEAADYCRWAGGTLPTEAQWEYAARGSSPNDPYGLLDEIAWTGSNSGKQHIDADKLFATDKAHYEQSLLGNGNQAHEVAQKKPNGFGLYDTIGNVAEWTADWLDRTYYAHSPTVDPTGPTTAQARVLRGGHFLYPSPPNRASKRLWAEPETRSAITGFRCSTPSI